MRRSRRLFDESQVENFNPDERYDLAYKRVKRIKGFYVHAIVYVFVNVFLIALKYFKSYTGSEGFFSLETFSTAIFWGIGLVAHGLSVFGRNIFFGDHWEEKKIQEFMEKDKTKKWE